MEYLNWKKYNIEVPYNKKSGKAKVFCPVCRDRRTNKRDKSLSVDLDQGLFLCHYCNYKGNVREMKKEESGRKKYIQDPYGKTIPDYRISL